MRLVSSGVASIHMCLGTLQCIHEDDSALLGLMLGEQCASDLSRYVTVSSWPARLACKNSFTRSHLLDGEQNLENRWA